MINGANTAAADAYRAASEVKADDQSSKDAAMTAAQNAADAAQALYDAGVSEDDDESEAGQAAVNAMNAAGIAWEAASGENPTTLDDPEPITYNVFIPNFAELKDDVTFGAATVDGTPVDIDNNGNIAVESTVGTSKTLKLVIAPKDAYRTITVKFGDTVVEDSSGYTGTISEDTIITITVTETYDLTVTDSTGDSLTIKKFVYNEAGAEVEATLEDNANAVKDDNDLRFYTDFEASATQRLAVTYAVNGEAEVTLTGEKVTNPATGSGEIVLYTIPAEVISSAETLTIELKKEAGTAVTFTEGDGSDTTKKVTKVEVWKDKTENGETFKDWVDVTTGDEATTVLKGDTIKFKPTVKDGYKIKQILFKSAEITPSFDGEAYEYKVEEAGAFSFVTEIDPDQSRVFTFKLTGAAGSAKVYISKVTPKAADGTEDTGNATTDKGEIKTALGGDSQADVDTSGSYAYVTVDKAINIPADVFSIEVTTEAATDYDITKVNGAAVADEDKDGKAYTVNSGDIGDFEVETEAEAAGDAKFFKIALPNTGASHIKLNINAGEKTDTTSPIVKTETNNVYKVNDLKTASFTITADEGYQLDETETTSFYAKLAAYVMGGKVDKAVVGNQVVYTVNLMTSKLGAAEGSAKDLTGSNGAAIAEAVRTFAATVEVPTPNNSSEYTAGTPAVTANGFGANGTDDTAIPYKAKLVKRFTAAPNFVITGVSYTMGGKTEEMEVLTPTGGGQTYAEVIIPEVTDDVKYKITTAKARALSLVNENDDSAVTKDGDNVYAVTAGAKYVIWADGATFGAAALAKISAEITEGGSVIGTAKKVGDELQVWMDKTWSGKELTVVVKEGDAVIGQLLLDVAKKRTILEINGGAAITQKVGTTMTYPIETDGAELPAIGSGTTATWSGDGTLAAVLDTSMVTIESGALKLNIPALKDEKVNTIVMPTKDTAGSKTPREVNLRLKETATGLYADVKVSFEAVLDTIGKPSVSAVTNGVSDTTINVDVSMDKVNTPENGKGKVWYIVTAKAAAKQPGETQNRDPKLKSEVTEIVEAGAGSTRVALEVANANLGDGASWTYDVTAKAVYVLAGTKPAASVTSDAGNDVSLVSDAYTTATQDTFFEATLKLVKDKGAFNTFYTGQSGLFYVATPKFSKITNYEITDVKVEDLSAETRADRITAKVIDGKVYVTDVPSTTGSIGKHTLQVTAKADMSESGSGTHHMYAARAKIDVKVVKGINAISVSASDKLYKLSGKKATLKPVITYNGGDKKNQPKAKKVTWYIGGVGTTNTDHLKPAPAGVTINQKNGTVTVAQNFTVDTRRPNNNKFVIIAKAADYAGSPTESSPKEVTITDKAVDLTNLVIADNADGGGMKIIATAGKKAVSVKADELDGAKVYALNAPLSQGTTVSADKWNALGGNDASFAGSVSFAPVKDKNKSLYVTSAGTVKVLKAGGKVTIDVSAKDGSKKKGKIALDLGYTDMPGNIAALNIQYTGVGKTPADLYKPVKASDATDVAKSYEVPGVAELQVTVKKAKFRTTNNAFEKFVNTDGFENYKLTVKGGSLNRFTDGYGNLNSYYTVYSTAKVTTIMLTTGKGKDAKKYTYTLTNTAYNAANTPKATLKGGLFEKNVDKQTLDLTVLNGKDTFGDNKYAKVELDWTALNAKNWEAMNALNNALGGGRVVKLDKETGKAGLVFDTDAYDLVAGNYKLKVTVGTGGTAAAFRGQTQPATVSVKVAKSKAFTFKLQTKYTLSKSESAVLTGKGNNGNDGVKANFLELQNDNKKGKSNNFTHYFKIETDAQTGAQYLTWNLDDEKVKILFYQYTVASNGKITFTNKLVENPDLSSIPKDDLTGYVRYNVEAKNRWYKPYKLENQYAKITVNIAKEAKNGKVKAVQKFVAQKDVQIKLTKGSAANVNLMVDGKYVSAVNAVLDTNAKNNAPELKLATKSVNNGQIVVEAAAGLDAEKKGGYTINLLVVPANSHYAKLIAQTNKQADKDALTVKYGIPVAVTVTANAKAKVNPAPVASDQKLDVVIPTADNIATQISAAVTVAGVEVLRDDANTSGGYVDATSQTSAQNRIAGLVNGVIEEYDGDATVELKPSYDTLKRASDTAATATVTYVVTYGGETADAECSATVTSDVDSVTITAPASSTFAASVNESCTATVTGKNGATVSQEVTWTATTGGSFSGATLTATQPSQGQSDLEFTITATSKRDKTVNAEKTITVTAATQ